MDKKAEYLEEKVEEFKNLPLLETNGEQKDVQVLT